MQRDKSRPQEKDKKRERARGTHRLESTEGRSSQDTEKKRRSAGHSLSGKCRGWGTSQDAERKRASKGRSRTGERRGKSQESEEASEKKHSRTEERRGMDKSGHREKASEQGGLTSWKAQRVGLVRTRKESEQTRILTP